MYVQPIRDIPNNTELSVCYIQIDQTTAGRRSKLMTLYNFRCNCRMCAESDAGLHGLSERDRQLLDFKCSNSSCAGVLAWESTEFDSTVDHINCSQCISVDFKSRLQSKYRQLMTRLDGVLNAPHSSQDILNVHIEMRAFLAPYHLCYYKRIRNVWRAAVAHRLPNLMKVLLLMHLPIIDYILGEHTVNALEWHVHYLRLCHQIDGSIQPPHVAHLNQPIKKLR